MATRKTTQEKLAAAEVSNQRPPRKATVKKTDGQGAINAKKSAQKATSKKESARKPRVKQSPTKAAIGKRASMVSSEPALQQSRVLDTAVSEGGVTSAPVPEVPVVVAPVQEAPVVDLPLAEQRGPTEKTISAAPMASSVETASLVPDARRTGSSVNRGRGRC